MDGKGSSEPMNVYYQAEVHRKEGKKEGRKEVTKEGRRHRTRKRER